MIDLHLHTNLSDGRKSNQEIINLAIQKNLKYIVCTDHDIINGDFVKKSLDNGLKTMFGTEISAFDKIGNKHIHLTCYSKNFNKKIVDILEKTREGRKEKINKQIELLKSNGFNIDKDKYYEFYDIKGTNLANLNISHLASYVYLFPENIELAYKLTGKKLSKNEFMKECLKQEGEYNYIGSLKIPEYEPNIETIGELAFENNAILSIAHPNFKFEIDEFRQRIEYFLDAGINAVEINAKASKEWVELILELKQKYNFILTFGSDSHFKDYTENEHGELGEINPYVPEDILRENIDLIFDR